MPPIDPGSNQPWTNLLRAIKIFDNGLFVKQPVWNHQKTVFLYTRKFYKQSFRQVKPVVT